MKKGAINHAGPPGITQDQTPAEISSRRLSIMPTHKLSGVDHNKIIRGIVNNTNDAAEIIRRELLICGTAMTVITKEVALNYAPKTLMMRCCTIRQESTSKVHATS